ncbi:MAG TPA: ABC transporter permease [Phycisphaerales bacterium]|nr:ABC transporter permease [Phycisphaerales bacterium]
MTFLLETIRLGLSNLRLHVLRSVLTALGIILGVAAVITMSALGEGSKRDALERIERLGARNIIVKSKQPPESMAAGQSQQQSWVSKYGLTRDDVRVITDLCKDAETIVPIKSIGSEVLRGALRKTSQAFGVTPELPKVANFRVARGRYLTEEDMEQRSDACVLGHEIAHDLFPFEDPLGGTVRIDTQVFTVVGVLAPVGLAGGAGAALVGRDFNFDVHVPLTTAYSRFGDMVFRRSGGQRSNSEVQIHELYFTSKSMETVMTDAALVRRAMETRHSQSKDYEIVIPYELLEEARKTALTMNVVFGAIAGIALLVGGIGIMNIMLASVTERTREIGIRRALGATRRHITWQFLVETGVLSATGGVIGVLCGVGLSFLVPPVALLLNDKADLHVQITTFSIVLSFGVAAAVGLIFGIYPARIAARQDPIVALRHD